MARISQFYGVVIAMYYNDHAPPHFHAFYGGEEAVIAIDTLEILEGGLPGRALGLVREWATLHRTALATDWDRARKGLSLDRIPPLG